LEDLQDAFDFCFKVHYQPGEERNRDPGYLQELQSLQAKLQNLDRQRREVLAQMQQLLGRSETLQELLQQELGGWRVRQQHLCLGASADTNLRPLETWFTELGQGLFQLRQLLRALGDLRQKVTYARDPLVAETPLLEQRLQEQLTHLLKRVTELQECLDNTPRHVLGCLCRVWSGINDPHGFLAALGDSRGLQEMVTKGDRAPGVFGQHSQARFGVSEQKDSRAGKGKGASGEVGTGWGWGGRGGARPGGDSGVTSPQGPLVVTEELHLITFTLAYAYCGLELELEATTLPFVIISNNNQFSSAWASILWFNMLSSDPK
ncbi:STAT2 protein, partial [Molothrus ater]|nr:STAT2 protein [Molothrus ater]